MTRTLAIDIGGTKFTMAVFEDDRLAERESHLTDREGGRVWMMARIFEIAAAWSAQQAFDRCGIGFGGPVDYANQTVAKSTHVGGWSDYPFVSELQSRFNMRVIMDNDANVGGLGEAVFGAGQGLRPLFYMTLSTGIGGGIITEQGIYR